VGIQQGSSSLAFSCSLLQYLIDLVFTTHNYFLQALYDTRTLQSPSVCRTALLIHIAESIQIFYIFNSTDNLEQGMPILQQAVSMSIKILMTEVTSQMQTTGRNLLVQAHINRYKTVSYSKQTVH